MVIFHSYVKLPDSKMDGNWEMNGLFHGKSMETFESLWFRVWALSKLWKSFINGDLELGKSPCSSGLYLLGFDQSTSIVVGDNYGYGMLSKNRWRVTDSCSLLLPWSFYRNSVELLETPSFPVEVPNHLPHIQRLILETPIWETMCRPFWKWY